MFDEYYSVSLSFWTRTGLREKARQGHLVGQLPWGYARDPDSGVAVPDPERAPLVRELFERYSGGQESDRTLAAWLNAKGAHDHARARLRQRHRPRHAPQLGLLRLRQRACGARTARSGACTSRSSPRSSSTACRRSEPGGRASSNPGDPQRTTCCASSSTASAAARACTAHAARAPPIRRYLCSTRRHGEGCDQPLAKAEPLEAQLVDWLRDFQPDARAPRCTSSRRYARAAATRQRRRLPARRRDLDGQLDRLRDLYVMGDLTKNEYVAAATGARGRAGADSDRPLDPAARRRPKRSSPTSPASGRPSRSPPSDAS